VDRYPGPSWRLKLDSDIEVGAQNEGKMSRAALLGLAMGAGTPSRPCTKFSVRRGLVNDNQIWDGHPAALSPSPRWPARPQPRF